MKEYALHFTSCFFAVSAKTEETFHWYKVSWIPQRAPRWWVTIEWVF